MSANLLGSSSVRSSTSAWLSPERQSQPWPMGGSSRSKPETSSTLLPAMIVGLSATSRTSLFTSRAQRITPSTIPVEPKKKPARGARSKTRRFLLVRVPSYCRRLSALGCFGEPHCHGVYAITQASRTRAVAEDVTEVRVTQAAGHFRAHHPQAAVNRFAHVLPCDGRAEARPSCAGFELRVCVE